MNEIEIEYDEAKRLKTLAERGLDFADTATVFRGDFIEFADDRRNYGEDRFIVYAMLDDRPVCFVWTPRGNVRRIISMRHVHDREFEARKRALD